MRSRIFSIARDQGLIDGAIAASLRALLAPLAQLRLRGLPPLLLFAPARQPPLRCRLGQARFGGLCSRLARRALATWT